MKNIITLLIVACPFLLSAQAPATFEFEYSDKMGKTPNEYISSKNLYIKDLITGRPQKLRIKLSQEERIQIQNKIMEINFFDYPAEYTFESAEPTLMIRSTMPCRHYSLTVFMDGKSKCVNWSNCMDGGAEGESKNRQYEHLQQLQMLINRIISGKPKYIKSKRPRGAYAGLFAGQISC